MSSRLSFSWFAHIVSLNTTIEGKLHLLEKAGKAQDQVAIPSQMHVQSDTSTKREETTMNDISDRSQEARFGFTNIGSTGFAGLRRFAIRSSKNRLGWTSLRCYHRSWLYSYYPEIIICFIRYLNEIKCAETLFIGEENGFAQSMTKLDDALARHGIDTTSCMQRAVCTYSQQAAAAVKVVDEGNEDEKVSSFDKMIDAITTNQIFRTAMQGTAIQEAIEAGRAGKNCSHSYSHCGFSMETMLSLLSNVITAVSAANVRDVTPTASSSL